MEMQEYINKFMKKKGKQNSAIQYNNNVIEELNNENEELILKLNKMTEKYNDAKLDADNMRQMLKETEANKSEFENNTKVELENKINFYTNEIESLKNEIKILKENDSLRESSLNKMVELIEPLLNIESMKTNEKLDYLTKFIKKNINTSRKVTESNIRTIKSITQQKIAKRNEKTLRRKLNHEIINNTTMKVNVSGTALTRLNSKVSKLEEKLNEIEAKTDRLNNENSKLL